MIVAGPDGLVKGQYRKFNIKSEDLTPGDDYAMMREVLTRRFKRIAAATAPTVDESPVDVDTVPETPADLLPPEEADEAEDAAFPDRPDLVLIDGGLGQLHVAQEVMADLGITDVALIGVAKGPDRDAGREHFHIPGRAQPMMLEGRDPVLYFVQRLRDEAHRFAIGAHRARRSKAIGANPLDEIGGIGPSRKRALLLHFGSAKGVSRASVSDLATVDGISFDTAQRIYDHFHERDR
jgi:excinuclease ABC subunit C